MSIIHQDLEPGVIDTAMIMQTLEKERPIGEAGRLAAEEGIVLEEVTSLRLEFLNILKIDHLWMMTSLVKLHIDNNIIEKIEGLSALVNLKELDLSFNNIESIENLEVLVKLEVLTLFENRIEKLQNMETLVNLMIFSVGNNNIEDREDVIYLRQFPQLRSLNMAGNPCETQEGDFREYICAFLPKLTYYEYRIITDLERVAAKTNHRSVLEKLEDAEEKERHAKEEQEARAEELKSQTEAFIENLDGDQLFLAMFENDDGKAFLAMGDAAQEVYHKFYDETVLVIQQIFKIGLEQHNIRQEEIRQFFNCVNAAKEETRVFSQQKIEEFLEKKTKLFLKIRKILQTVEESVDTDQSANRGEYITKLQRLADEFNQECKSLWYILMAKELAVYEQIEEIGGNFERNLNELVSNFIEAAQSLFVQIRNLQTNYNEEISEVANAYLTNLNISTHPVPSDLKIIMTDKESLNSATTQSHDLHLQVIDNREDQLTSRTREWVQNYCEEIDKERIEYSRKLIIEINHFLDIQREEFEDLHNLTLAALPPPDEISEIIFDQEEEEEEKENEGVEDEGEVSITERKSHSMTAANAEDSKSEAEATVAESKENGKDENEATED
ncbi:dynein regulatory complex subunit 3-like [Periplaneta americana]|uniref:dynein regulatory complex subunit 3-like n=1 Tax=Periplaneta americana TaxID=6978 RepID=UPI0037E77A5C